MARALAGLASLQIVGSVTGVHRGTAGTDSRTHLVGQRRHHFIELLAAAHVEALAVAAGRGHGFRGVKANGAHGDHLDDIMALHSGNSVVGLVGVFEGVDADHLGDVADLDDIEIGGHARGYVLAAGGGRKEDVAVDRSDG